MTTMKNASNVVVRYKDPNGEMKVITPDNGVMVEEAIEACRAFSDQIEFKKQFDSLIHKLAKWLSIHDDKIDRALLTTRNHCLLFLIVWKEASFNEHFEEDLTELDLEISRDEDYSRIPFAVHSLPHCLDGGVDSFVSKALRIRFVRDGQ